MEVTGFKAHHFTIIGQNTVIDGNLNLQDESQIWGQVTGNIVTLEKVFIERTAMVKGNLKCRDVVISGELHGDIEASGIVTLRSSAKYYGKIQAEDIIIHPGAFLEADLNTID